MSKKKPLPPTQLAALRAHGFKPPKGMRKMKANPKGSNLDATVSNPEA